MIGNPNIYIKFAFKEGYNMIGKNHIGQLLLLCFSVFLGHNLVPHHHHSELIIPHPGDSCPIEHEDHRATCDHPAHCHAFNKVAFNKVESSVWQEDSRKTTVQPIAYSTAPVCMSGAPKNLAYSLLKVPLFMKFWGGPAAARAPPPYS
jgi:hypothetical protein